MVFVLGMLLGIALALFTLKKSDKAKKWFDDWDIPL